MVESVASSRIQTSSLYTRPAQERLQKKSQQMLDKIRGRRPAKDETNKLCKESDCLAHCERRFKAVSLRAITNKTMELFWVTADRL